MTGSNLEGSKYSFITNGIGGCSQDLNQVNINTNRLPSDID